MTVAWVIGLGLLGVLSRYGLGALALRVAPSFFPYATLGINVVGALLIGWVYASGVEREMISPALRTGMMVGFLGGFTTFSSFAMETVVLVESGRLGFALLYVVASNGLGLAAALAGLALGRA